MDRPYQLTTAATHKKYFGRDSNSSSFKGECLAFLIQASSPTLEGDENELGGLVRLMDSGKSFKNSKPEQMGFVAEE